MEGWIKLHRKVIESNMYRCLNAKQRDVMIQCLLLANHADNEWMWGGVVHKCKPGQFVTSLDRLLKLCARETKVQSLRTALRKLEGWGFLTNESTKSGRIITIVNWETYQAVDCDTNKAGNKELTKSQQTPNKELTPNKNVKNEKNEKKSFCPESAFAVPDGFSDGSISKALKDKFGDRLSECREDTVQRLISNLYSDVYSGVDVAQEVNKAAIWEDSNPTKRKTARGIPKFLTGWMERAQNSQGGRRQQSTKYNDNPRRPPNVDLYELEMEKQRKREMEDK